MHYPKLLEKFSCTQDTLRDIFTAQAPGQLGEKPTDAEREAFDKQTKKVAVRRAAERRIRNRIFEGVGQNCKNARPYQAVDMAMDAPPIQRQTIPLMMWATGKINAPGLFDLLKKNCGEATAKKFFKKVPTENDVIEPDVPKICGISIDLVRSYVTRRHAAMDALWSNQYPLYDYQARGVDPVALLRADLITERVDMISDGYNYRHHDSQCRRDMLQYGTSTIFPRSSWDRQVGWRPKAGNVENKKDVECESYVEREGIEYVNPHPSRIFYDIGSPLANINSNTGPKWIGYWDIVRVESLWAPDGGYFNMNAVFCSEGWTSLITQWAEFFGFYFDKCTLTFPNVSTMLDPALANDRSAQIGIYTSQMKDMGVLLTQYSERINPKRMGYGEYDADIWVRYVVAGDCTIIGAEYMPSLPACNGAVNWTDNRMANQSMAMALLSYQDQASNIMTHMLEQIRASLVQLWLIDKDCLEEPIRKQIEDNADNASWWVEPKKLVYSASKLRDMGFSPRDAFQIVQNQMTNVVQNGLTALGQLLNLADRLLILSPNELGQPIQRESSAREVQEIATSVQSIYSFINQGPREQLAAKKEMLFESLICCGTESLRVPVMSRYTIGTIKAAGFTVENMEQFRQDSEIVPVETPILGSIKNLVYDYYFNTRDGAERVVNTQSAQVMMQLVQAIMQSPPLTQAIGSKAILEMLNTTIRLSGAPTDIQIDTVDGKNPDLQQQPDPAAQQQKQQSDAAVQAINDLAVRTQRNENLIKILLQKIGVVPPPDGSVPPEPAGTPPPPPNQAAPPPAAPPVTTSRLQAA